ncbi:MAG: hypothetical protein WBW01_04440 [Terriglobales bacterium]
MSAGAKAEVVFTLEQATGELQALALITETEIRSVARVFESLAGHTDAILTLAAAIVKSVDNESVSSVLPKVQTLGAAAKRFIGDRLQATGGILETVAAEVKLLHQLSLVAHGQETIAFQIKVLSMLTNIEVAHLGAAGAGFHYLANELAEFSKSMTRDTQELSSRTEGRKKAIEETRSVLSAELPRQRLELARIEVDLGKALAVVDSGLTQLSRTPAQFKTCVEDIARQVAGVVAAIQAHDITRQQIEHVEGAFALIEVRMHGAANAEPGAARERTQAYVGLAIQIYQLRAIKETVANWALQIRTCLSGIMRVSTSEVVGIGPVVLEQEREVSSQLAQIGLLERESQAYSGRIQNNLGGLSNLMQLVSEHLQRSKSVRDRLQMLTLNSIVEASRLGARAATISAIAACIKDVSAQWNQITEQSGQAMQGILNLVKQTNEVMKAFSESSNQTLSAAQVQTRGCLDDLRAAASSAAGQAQGMKEVTEKMQAKIAEVGNTGDLIDAGCGRIDSVLGGIEAIRRQLEIDHPEVTKHYDRAEVEQLFAVSYTTEMERDVLRAALAGKPLPVAQQTFAGNSVELF